MLKESNDFDIVEVSLEATSLGFQSSFSKDCYLEEVPAAKIKMECRSGPFPNVNGETCAKCAVISNQT